MNRRGLAKYISAGIWDQGFASGSSFLASLIALRHSDAREAFEFSIAFLAFGFIGSLVRSITSEPLAVFRHRDPEQSGARTRADPTHVLVALFLALVGAAAFGLLYSFRTPLGVVSLGSTVFAVGALIVRSDYSAVARQGIAAVVSTAQFCFVLAGSLASLFADDPIWVILGWLIGSAAVTAFGLLGGWSVGARGSLAPETWGYLGEFLVTAGASQGAIFAGSSLLSADLAVATRIGSTCFGPYQLLVQAGSLMAIPLFLSVRPGYSTRQQASLFSGALLVSLLAWSAILIPLLTRWGQSLFGDSWEMGAPYLLAYALSQAPAALASGVFVAMRATANVKTSLAIRVVGGVTQCIFPILFGSLFGIAGFFIGTGCASLVVALAGAWFISRFGQPGTLPRSGLRTLEN